MRKISLLFTLLFIAATLTARAQEAEPEMADAMHANGKIYVVVLVLATIFAGIIFSLIRLDRKITKLEKANKQ